jgi:cytoskeleton protein RodZ
MDDFGAHLREARERQGVGLRQIATATKISMAVLEALERNDFSRLPGGIFSRAFVRAYAIEVNLDPDQTVQEFLVEYEKSLNAAAQRVPRPEVTADDREFLARQQRAGRLLRVIVIGLVLIAVAAFFTWQFRSRVKSPAPPDAPPPSAAALPSVAPPDTAPPAPESAAKAPVVSNPVPSTPVASTGQIAVHLDAGGESWVRVTVDGTVAVEETLRAGDRRDFKPGRDVYLQVGNAGVVKWTINGQPARDLGKPGQPGTARLTSATLSKYLQ